MPIHRAPGPSFFAPVAQRTRASGFYPECRRFESYRGYSLLKKRETIMSTGMSKTYSISDMRDLEPCYDPGRYLPDDWTGTVLDVLHMDDVPPDDRLWVAVHWISDATLRLWAVWCARQALSLIDAQDPRSIAACDVAERFALGEATEEELSAASEAASEAARAADSEADSEAAWAAAMAAARAAAMAAAWAAAREAAAAWAAAKAAAREAAWAAQLNQLVLMVEAAVSPE